MDGEAEVVAAIEGLGEAVNKLSDADAEQLIARISGLRGKVAVLAAARDDVATEQVLLQQRVDEFERENAGLMQAVREGEAALKQQENEIRTDAVELVKEGRTKIAGYTLFVDGLTVTNETVVKITDRYAALLWAQEHKMAVVPESLDEKMFVKIVKALPVLPPCVTISKEPKVAIKTDLSFLLPTANRDTVG